MPVLFTMRRGLFLLLVFHLSAFAQSATSPKSLKVNIVCQWNMGGLNRDAQLLIHELKLLGHQAAILPIFDLNPRPKADVNIFLESLESRLFDRADLNYFIPNPEHCPYSNDDFQKIDLVFCKTREAERAFKPLHPNTVFTSFTSRDCYQEHVKRDYYAPFHLQGGSVQKGTPSIIDVWLKNPVLPALKILKYGDNHRAKGMEREYPPIKNLEIIDAFISDDDLVRMQNEHGFHLCTSNTEGFGHSIWEALSCGAVVVTTDAPPMNEFVKDPHCLVPVSHSAPWYYATRYYVNKDKYDLVLTNLFNLPEDKLEEIGRKNREHFLENHRFFQEQLAKIFPPYVPSESSEEDTEPSQDAQATGV